MGGQLDRHILLLWQPAIVLLLLCYLKLVWQINSLSLSLSIRSEGAMLRLRSAFYSILINIIIVTYRVQTELRSPVTRYR